MNGRGFVAMTWLQMKNVTKLNLLQRYNEISARNWVEMKH